MKLFKVFLGFLLIMRLHATTMPYWYNVVHETAAYQKWCDNPDCANLKNLKPWYKRLALLPTCGLYAAQIIFKLKSADNEEKFNTIYYSDLLSSHEFCHPFEDAESKQNSIFTEAIVEYGGETPTSPSPVSFENPSSPVFHTTTPLSWDEPEMEITTPETLPVETYYDTVKYPSLPEFYEIPLESSGVSYNYLDETESSEQTPTTEAPVEIEFGPVYNTDNWKQNPNGIEYAPEEVHVSTEDGDSAETTSVKTSLHKDFEDFTSFSFGGPINITTTFIKFEDFLRSGDETPTSPTTTVSTPTAPPAGIEDVGILPTVKNYVSLPLSFVAIMFLLIIVLLFSVGFNMYLYSAKTRTRTDYRSKLLVYKSQYYVIFKAVAILFGFVWFGNWFGFI